MEFPSLGKHCSEPFCKQLDFLPMKCDACANIFCRDHIVYATHCCTESYKKNNKIPVCPLCNLPCPTKKGEVPDIVIGRHIESDCMSDPAKGRRKVYTNKCSKKGCKKKELVPVRCGSCQLNFCFHHRHVQDHACKGFQDSGKSVSKAGAAAILRSTQTSENTLGLLLMFLNRAAAILRSTQTSEKASQQAVAVSSQTQSGHSNRRAEHTKVGIGAHIQSLQGALDEEEALAMAVKMSLAVGTGQDQAVNDGMTDQEKEDFLLALTLAAGDQETLMSRQLTQKSVKV